jgi:hypothetical protein
MIGPSAGLGEGVELRVPPDHRADPLARGRRQLLERDLADDPVAHVAPGQRRLGHWQHDQPNEQVNETEVHNLLTTNA